MTNKKNRSLLPLCLLAYGLGASAIGHAQTAATRPAPASITVAPAAASALPTPGRVVASGVVPDEATRVIVLTRLRELYGAEAVDDQLAVGNVIAPANWTTYVQRMLSPGLKQVTRGQMSVNGNLVELRGEVANEAMRQQVLSDISKQLNETYTVRSGLRVGAAEQSVVDDTLANRIVEFDPGSAQLTPRGQGLLDEMAVALQKIGARRIEIVGHTDGYGQRLSNIALSIARADVVRNYLIAKGVEPHLLSSSGVGPDRPIASNETLEGRARNRRIEFRVAQ
jgi:OOP family OmpA-OmpF porin